MICKKCNTEVNDGVKFCYACGEKIEEEMQPVENGNEETSNNADAFLQEKREKTKGKKKTGLIIGLILGTVVIIAVIFVLLKLFAGTDSKFYKVNYGTSTRIEVDSLTNDIQSVNPDKTIESMQTSENKDGTSTLEGIECKDSVLAIPAKDEKGKAITEIEERVLGRKDNVETLIFDGVSLKIDGNAFSGTGIKKLVFRNSEIELDDSAIKYCDKLETIEFYNCQVVLGDYVFYGSGKNADLLINCCNVEVDGVSFAGLDLASIHIANSILDIGKGAFKYCDDIDSIVIENCEGSIDEYAFYGAGDDASLVISSCNMEFENECFSGLGVKSVEFDNMDVNLGKKAFYLCDSMVTFTVKGGSFSCDDYSFYYCDKLEEVSICEDAADTTIELGEAAFGNCDKLRKVTLGGGKVVIGDKAFAYLDKLEEVQIGKGDVEYGDYVFLWCDDSLEVYEGGKKINVENAYGW